MVIHFPAVNLLHFCSGLKAQHVLITVALNEVAALITAPTEERRCWCGQLL